jgi:Sulfotransferase family
MMTKQLSVFIFVALLLALAALIGAQNQKRRMRMRKSKDGEGNYRLSGRRDSELRAARDSSSAAVKFRAPGNHRFLFVGGLQRSGTTPLMRALSEFEDVSHLGERHFDSAPSYWPMFEGKFAQSVLPYPNERYTLFDGGAHAGPTGRQCSVTMSGQVKPWGARRPTERWSGVNDVNAEKLWSEWSRGWDLSRRWLMAKSPEDLLMTRAIGELLKPSRFLIVVRHPAVVAMAQSKWASSHAPGEHNYAALIENWVQCHRYVRHDVGVRGDNVRIVYYEHFRDHAEELYELIAQWLGIGLKSRVEIRRHAIEEAVRIGPHGRNTKYAAAIAQRNAIGNATLEEGSDGVFVRNHRGQLYRPYGAYAFPLTELEREQLSSNGATDVAMRKYGYSMDKLDEPTGMDCRSSLFRPWCAHLIVPKSKQSKFVGLFA